MTDSKSKIIRTVITVIITVLVYFLLINFFSGQILSKGGPYSLALYDSDNNLIGAQSASDGQWRFEKGNVNPKFEKAIICYEDKRFYFHQGIDFLSIARALKSNLRSKKIVSGASTITMQTVRLLDKNPRRTYAQKIREMFYAVILELKFSKKTILSLYAENAPFGGNVVGLEAACWRYFHTSVESITWAEAATLAVLPNQPSLVHPGANRDILLAKRNRLLEKLYEKKIIDGDTYHLSLEEPIPESPYALPRLAPHYLEYLKNKNPEESKFYSSIDNTFQNNLYRILENRSEEYSRLGINNACAIIIDTSTHEVLAYIGNTGRLSKRNSGNFHVDIVQSRRSSGSLLKPFLFGAMLDKGLLLDNQLVLDIPTRIGSYKVENNIQGYSGAVRAREALSRSLNIPAVLELRTFGITAFLDILKKSGFTTFTGNANYYGLPLILGGGELTLFEAVNAYAGLMNSAKNENKNFPVSRAASYLTLTSLSEGNRPLEEALWQRFANSKKIAWKTGTSNGNRDAWCIGVTGRYTVGVWCGNAGGKGNKNLSSSTTAAPLMFEIFTTLQGTDFPELPVEDIEYIEVCKYSGYPKSPSCPSTIEGIKIKNASIDYTCPFCAPFSFTPDGKFQGNIDDMKGPYKGKMPLIKNCFILPPQIEYWYIKSEFNYSPLPPFVEGHLASDENTFSIIFPMENSKIIIPVEIDSKEGEIVMQAAARNSSSILYWDIDGEYIGSTKDIHIISARPPKGKHILTVTESSGLKRTRRFEVLED